MNVIFNLSDRSCEGLKRKMSMVKIFSVGRTSAQLVRLVIASNILICKYFIYLAQFVVLDLTSGVSGMLVEEIMYTSTHLRYDLFLSRGVAGDYFFTQPPPPLQWENKHYWSHFQENFPLKINMLILMQDFLTLNWATIYFLQSIFMDVKTCKRNIYQLTLAQLNLYFPLLLIPSPFSYSNYIWLEKLRQK